MKYDKIYTLIIQILGKYLHYMAEKKEVKKGNGNYNASAITVLEGLDPVRKRPGMYIGSTSSTGLHHLIWEAVDNAIDEAMAGYCNRVVISLLPKGVVSVSDNGRGIPVDKHPVTKLSALETVMTKLHAGGKFGGEGYKVSGGLHGVGISVVNALSKWMKTEVKRDGKIWSMEFACGKPASGIKSSGSVKDTGTTQYWIADDTIFSETEYDFQYILDHLRQQAYLTKGVTIVVEDKREDDNHQSYTFYFEGGIASYVGYLNRAHEVAQEKIFYVEKDLDNVAVEVAVQYANEYRELVYSFANNIYTIEGGMHMVGFRSALTRVLNNYARKNNILKEKDPNLTGDDVREGLTAVISVKLPDPQFEGQTKAKLGNAEVRTVVETITNDYLAAFLEENPRDAKMIISKCLLAAQARFAAKAARDTVLRKGVLDGFALPGKLADCSSKKPEDSEIFIVEGDSAGGSAKQGRDRHIQAILPLRGKILNVEKARLDKMLQNNEIKSLILAMGTNIGDQFDITQLRYHKIVIMTDADVDGSHIRTLLLTLFYRHFPDIINAGHLYIAMPPLFRMQKGKDVRYIFNEAELEKVQKEFGGEVVSVFSEDSEAGGELEGVTEMKTASGAKIVIQRYKGLGEMNPEQLWETTMDPSRRVVKQVTIDDAAQADEIFDILMGSEVGPRRRFIQTNAANVKNLDI